MDSLTDDECIKGKSNCLFILLYVFLEYFIDLISTDRKKCVMALIKCPNRLKPKNIFNSNPCGL